MRRSSPARTVGALASADDPLQLVHRERDPLEALARTGGQRPGARDLDGEIVRNHGARLRSGERTVNRVIRVGCSDVPPGVARERYHEALDYLEVPVNLREPVRPAVMARRRRETPAGVGLGLVINGFHVGPAARDAMAGISDSVTQLQAEVVVFRTTAEVTPSAASRDALRDLFGVHATADRLGGALRAWEPHGLWQAATAAKVAADLGLAYVCDPLARDPFGPPLEFYAGLGGAAYFRLTGLGGGGRDFGQVELEVAATLAGAYPRAWLVLTNPGRFRDAVKLRQMIGGGEAPPEDG